MSLHISLTIHHVCIIDMESRMKDSDTLNWLYFLKFPLYNEQGAAMCVLIVVWRLRIIVDMFAFWVMWLSSLNSDRTLLFLTHTQKIKETTLTNITLWKFSTFIMFSLLLLYCNLWIHSLVSISLYNCVIFNYSKLCVHILLGELLVSEIKSQWIDLVVMW